jgi:AraC-like DNA-binding protein
MQKMSGPRDRRRTSLETAIRKSNYIGWSREDRAIVSSHLKKLRTAQLYPGDLEDAQAAWRVAREHTSTDVALECELRVLQRTVSGTAPASKIARLVELATHFEASGEHGLWFDAWIEVAYVYGREDQLLRALATLRMVLSDNDLTQRQRMRAATVRGRTLYFLGELDTARREFESVALPAAIASSCVRSQHEIHMALAWLEIGYAQFALRVETVQTLYPAPSDVLTAELHFCRSQLHVNAARRLTNGSSEPVDLTLIGVAAAGLRSDDLEVRAKEASWLAWADTLHVARRPSFYQTLATAYRLTGRWSEAIGLFDRVLAVTDSGLASVGHRTTALFGLAVCHRSTDRALSDRYWGEFLKCFAARSAAVTTWFDTADLIKRFGVQASVLPPTNPAQTPGIPSNLAQAIEWIARHLADDIAIDKVASVAEVSRRTLESLFVAHCYCSPARYIRDQRLDKARELLRTTPKNIKEIAQLVGLRSQGHLSTLYRSRWGVAPRDDRRLPEA